LTRHYFTLEALDIFYASKENPDNFETFQASNYALCGKYERLTASNNLIIKEQLEKKRMLQKNKPNNARKK